jgi:peptidyl-prolyl cis-trans isomerase A (cyclophilin A)
MKKALLTVLLCGAAFAQTKSAAPKSAPAAKPDLLNPASWKAQAPAVYRAKLTTTKGVVVIEVTRTWAPRGADRFYNLVRSGYFTDAPFFRVISGFMAQFGISARVDVNRAWDKASFADDKGMEMHSNKRGMVTFATTGQPNTRGTQLFINYGDNANLDALGFVPIGEVVEGMDIVDMFYSGYGETVSKEGDLENGGKAYVDRNMPKLDRILTAVIVPVPPAAPKPAADAKQ